MEKLPTILIPRALQKLTPTERLEILRQTVRPVGTHHSAPKGHSETQFERDLWQYFPGKIYTGLLVKRSDLQQPYVPDFVYIDSSVHLHIDIEVDEPYSHISKQPLHVLDCPKDVARNQFFLAQGWVVLRLSEAQVVKTPASCCKAIAATIASLTGDNALMTPFRQIPTLKPEWRWSREDAQQMADVAYRDSYLSSASQPEPQKKRRRQNQANKSASIANSQLTFYCPICGDAVRWQGHYVQCSTCGNDQFVV